MWISWMAPSINRTINVRYRVSFLKCSINRHMHMTIPINNKNFKIWTTFCGRKCTYFFFFWVQGLHETVIHSFGFKAVNCSCTSDEYNHYNGKYKQLTEMKFIQYQHNSEFCRTRVIQMTYTIKTTLIWTITKLTDWSIYSKSRRF